MGVFWSLLPQILSKFAEILTGGSTLTDKNICEKSLKKWKNVYEKSLKDSSLYRKGMDPLFTLLVQLWYPFPLEDGRNWKKCAVVKNNFSHWAIQICQNQDSISSPLSGKNMITFWTIWAIFGKKQGGVTRQSVRIKIGHVLF